MFNRFIEFEKWLGSIWGYASIIYLENLLVFLSGVFIGTVIMAFAMGIFFLKSKRIEGKKFDKFGIIKYVDGTEKTYFLNPKNIFEIVFMTFSLIFSPLFTIKNYTIKDEKRTFFFVSILLFLGVIVLILSFIATFTVFTK